jgi:hypothetical protein
VWVEPLFAEGKQWHTIRRFRGRRLWRANCEALVIATGQNLQRLLQKLGWGSAALPYGSRHGGQPCLLDAPVLSAARRHGPRRPFLPRPSQLSSRPCKISCLAVIDGAFQHARTF